MDRATKEAFVSEFSEKLSRAQLAVVTDYRGLDVEQLTQFRKALAAVGGTEYSVVKNRLAQLALKGTPYESLSDQFSGPNGVLLGYGDVVEAAKILTDFAKENEDMDVKVGGMDGHVLSAADIQALASLPPKEVLQAQLLGVLQGPSRNLVSVLANVNRQILNVLSAYKGKLEAPEDG